MILPLPVTPKLPRDIESMLKTEKEGIIANQIS